MEGYVKKGQLVLSRIRVNVELLADGICLNHPIQDEQGRELLASSVPISVNFLDQLRKNGISWVMLHTLDATEVMGAESDSTDPESQQTESNGVWKPRTPSRATPSQNSVKARVDSLGRTASFTVENSGPPLKETISSKGCVPFDSSQKQLLEEHFSNASKLLDGLIDEVLEGKTEDSHQLDSVAGMHINSLTDDSDLALFAAGELSVSPEIAERSMRLSLISMALGVELGFDENHVREIGLCGLVCDWGKCFLPEKLQDERRPLAAAEIETFRVHPLYTAELLASIDGISREVRLAATQVRENADGSGYPRGLKDDQIHPYARILQVANVYLALTSRLRGRDPFAHYDVMVYLLHQTKSGRMTQVPVRALLNVVSLFPIGSLVQLEDGTEAQVIRRNELNYTSPIVQKLGDDRQIRIDQPQDLIDLSKTTNSVKTALPLEKRGEKRMRKDAMSQILWSDT